jgi:hypothetical protein
MDVLTLFGLFAVPAMLVFYMLEDRTLGSFLPSPARAPSAQLTASFIALIPLKSVAVDCQFRRRA